MALGGAPAIRSLAVASALVGAAAALAGLAAVRVAAAAEPPRGSGSPERTGGPDAFGHRFFDSRETYLPFSFVNISGSGVFVGDGDDRAFTIVLPAPFTLYGTTFGSLRMSTNGFVTPDLLDPGGDAGNDCPLPAPPVLGVGERIYVLHDNLFLRVGSGGMYYRFESPCSRPNDLGGEAEACSILMWNDVERYSTPPYTWDPSRPSPPPA